MMIIWSFSAVAHMRRNERGSNVSFITVRTVSSHACRRRADICFVFARMAGWNALMPSLGLQTARSTKSRVFISSRVMLSYGIIRSLDLASAIFVRSMVSGMVATKNLFGGHVVMVTY